jgi:hypothetical protein
VYGVVVTYFLLRVMFLLDYVQLSAEIANPQAAVIPAWIAGIQNTGM